MIAIKIMKQKNFMAKLLTSELFDNFLVEEVVIDTYNTFTVDGHIHNEFYKNADDEDEGCPKEDFSKCSGEQCYLFKFYDSNGEILFSKIGTTTRNCRKRIKEEIAYYRKRGLDVAETIIEDVFCCGDTPAEAYESFMRAKFIKQFPNTWCRNDRFFGVDIPVTDFRHMCEMFASL